MLNGHITAVVSSRCPLSSIPLFVFITPFLSWLDSKPSSATKKQWCQEFFVIYGTSHSQLKCSLHVTCACKTQSLHTLLLHVCICMCFLALHHKYVRKHTHLHWIITHKIAHACARPMAKIFL